MTRLYLLTISLLVVVVSTTTYLFLERSVENELDAQTRSTIKEFRLDDYLFCVEAKDLSEKEFKRLHKLLRREISEIFYGRNLSRSLEF